MNCSPERQMRPREFDLVLALAETRFSAHELNIETLMVQEMDDGGMGSLRFVTYNNSDRSFGQEVAHVTFADRDGVSVSATLNLDNHGDLFELDIFKADSTPLLDIAPVAQMTFHNVSE